MNRIARIFSGILLLTTLSTASAETPHADLIVGNWSCTTDNVTYTKDGQWKTSKYLGNYFVDGDEVVIKFYNPKYSSGDKRTTMVKTILRLTKHSLTLRGDYGDTKCHR